MTQQPVWKYLGHVGDVDPIAYGGGFVYVDETGVYQPDMVYFEPAPDEQWHKTEGKTPVTIYRFNLDRLEIVPAPETPNGEYVIGYGMTAKAERGELPYPLISYREWFDSWDESPYRTTNKLADVAATNGMNELQLRQMFCDENPMVRAQAYVMLGQYHGFENLDSYPFKLTEDEAYSKYAEEMKQWQVNAAKK